MHDQEREGPAAATGGCQCGAVRYAIRGSRDTWECNVCHCRMCQKAGGGPFMVFVNVPRAEVERTRGERASFKSSSIAARGYCRDCGTPLTYERTADRISVAHGTLDDPSIMAPTTQLVGDGALPWSGSVADLPVERLDDWLAQLPDALTSRQHPDRD